MPAAAPCTPHAPSIHIKHHPLSKAFPHPPLHRCTPSRLSKGTADVRWRALHGKTGVKEERTEAERTMHEQVQRQPQGIRVGQEWVGGRRGGIGRAEGNGFVDKGGGQDSPQAMAR
eukprot:4588377-Alexandrium_andersonii.AAC.1